MSAVERRRDVVSLNAPSERRLVTLREAAGVTGVSVSSLRRWQRAGRISAPVADASVRIVDLDEVMRKTAAPTPGPAKGALVALRPRPTALLQLCAFVAASHEAAVDATRRRAVAEAEAAILRDRICELETWIDDAARADRVEELQLGRLLALASAEREERRPSLLPSGAAVLAALYAVAVVCLVWMMLTGRLG